MGQHAFFDDVVKGLTSTPKTIPSKYLYDAEGARLFDEICLLPEYYPTRTELAITRHHATEIASLFGVRCRLVELGSGSSMKTRILLDHARGVVQYVPVDIAPAYLEVSVASLRRAYPDIEVTPVCADYGRPFELPKAAPRIDRTVVYFPGSTIGNLHPAEAASFLGRLRDLVGKDGGLLIGVDLTKPIQVVEAAYNDLAGVTAAFNLNLLVRLNRELGTDFAVDAFRHKALYDPHYGRIEMHLVSAHRQTVRLGGVLISFEEGESILTEYSYKYSLEEFARVAARAGLAVERVFTDEARLFSLQWVKGASPHEGVR